MSNYKLSSPIDVSSSSTSGQINLYDIGGSFAVNIKAPAALLADVPFVLPASDGSTNQVLTYGSTNTWSNGGINHTSLPLCLTFKTSLTLSASVTSATFTNVGVLYFFGTTLEGTPSAIYAVIGGIASVGAQVRLYDNTNAVIIGTSTAVTTTTTHQIVQIPITNPFNASAAQLYVQIARTTSGTVQIWSIHILP